MDNLEFFTDEYGTEYVRIDRGNNEFSVIIKSVYDEQQAKQNEGVINAN